MARASPAKEQETVASQLGLSDRTIRYWLSQALLGPSSSNRVAEVLPEEAKASPAGETKDSSSINIHTEWTVPELLAMGISHRDVPRISLLLTTLS